MTKRKCISKRVRFEVLKRDSFTCQYCGKMPPDTILHIDHIKPVSKGGNNGMLNLVTSCQDCNLGKSDIALSDNSSIKKQQAQIAQMAEKKAQIEMMVEWRESLLESDEILVKSAAKLINTYLDEYDKCVSSAGISSIRKAIKSRGYQDVMSSIESLYCSDRDFAENWSKAIKYSTNENKPNIHYVKGILRNRFSYFNQNHFYLEMKNLIIDDELINDLLDIAKTCKSPGEFYALMDEVI